MPRKRKQQKSAFFYFMMDYKKRQEAKGEIFPGGLSDIPAACSEEWKGMTPQQKGPYESQAKNAKIKDGLSGMKYTSQGVPIALIEKEAKRKQELEDNMNDYIKVTVESSGHRDSLIGKRFYFIHVNYLCRITLPNGESDFIPAEFAVTEFTLKNGVQNTYHEIIDIDIPTGYMFDVIHHSDNTHKINKNHSDGESNFIVMYQRLKGLLAPETIGEELPPLYTTRALMEIVPGLLSRIAKAAGRSLGIFRVYCIETLFFHLRNAAISNINNVPSATGFPSLPLAAQEIQKDRFDRAPGIACEYHTELEDCGIHCSQSIVIRWAYIICDFCCMDLDIEMIPGSHCPWNTDVDGIMDSKESSIREVLSHSRSENFRGLASMTGVTEEYRLRTSERTHAEEMARRQNSRPLQIIDHSKLQNTNKREVNNSPQPTSTPQISYSDYTRKKVERDLRLPTTKSWAMMGAKSEGVPNMDETNFPAIGGRGLGLKKNFDNNFPPIGRGRGLPFGN